MKRFAWLVGTAPPLIAVTMMIAPATAQGEVYLAGKCFNSEVQPSRVTLTCADGRLYLQNLSWQSWGAPEATANGDLVQPDCPLDVPLAACETNRSDAASVTAYSRQFCAQDRKTHYTQVHVVAPSAPTTQDFVQPFPCGLYPDLYSPLRRGEAKRWVGITMGNQQNLSWNPTARGHRIDCDKRLSKRVRACSVTWANGDFGFVGRVVIHKLDAGYWKARWRLKRFNDYCLFVTHGHHCVKVLAGHDTGFE